MLELIVHGFVLLMVFIDLYQHWTHHRRKKAQRPKLYTLDEAKAVLFEQAVKEGFIKCLH